MIRSAIRALSRKRLYEVSAAFWTDAELNTWIDNGCDDIAFRTKCIRDNGKMTTVSGTQEYTLSTTFPTLNTVLEVYYLKGGTTWEKLDSTTREELNKTDRGWKSALAGTPDRYYWDREEDIIAFYPKPDTTNAGTDYAEVYYGVKHTPIAADDSAIDIPYQLHLAVIEFVVATGLDTRGWGDKSNDAWQKYYTKVHEYMVERNREREDDDIVMKSYKNI